MSVSYSVYVGPYLEAPNPEKPSMEQFNGCVNDKCKNEHRRSSDIFCPQCGKKCGTVSVTSTSRIDFDVYEECDERLSKVSNEDMPSDLAIFEPNKGKFGRRFSAYDSSIVELNETIIADEVSRFKSFFTKDIARIKEVFGKATVKWGVVAYAS